MTDHATFIKAKTMETAVKAYRRTFTTPLDIFGCKWFGTAFSEEEAFAMKDRVVGTTSTAVCVIELKVGGARQFLLWIHKGEQHGSSEGSTE
jgi:hypothetical protein